MLPQVGVATREKRAGALPPQQIQKEAMPAPIPEEQSVSTAGVEAPPVLSSLEDSQLIKLHPAPGEQPLATKEGSPALAEQVAGTLVPFPPRRPGSALWAGAGDNGSLGGAPGN